MLKAILFDFDGVLVESVDIKTKAFAKLFESEGKEIVDQVVEYHLANGGVSRYKKFEYIYEKLLGKHLNAEISKDLGERFSHLVIQNVIDAPWVSGAKNFLEEYYQEIDLYIVSGTPEDELKSIVNRKSIKKYFKGTYGSPETKGNLIKRILSGGDYTKDQVVFVGDAITDLNGALDSDVPFIGRLSDENNNPFKEYDIPIISDLWELPELLK
ncbi:HAD family hydrolase [Methanococcoides orientis]|uniref:HAD family hydrolase n=1 Tax=Methanococcoides orientis TaxID=2822137 RepID=UPI001E2832D0|nr:HAD hydrolase-like protein [Methanococcoides orientis]UGV40295.1 HAD family hydrolase [Methanococcoides orientis]